MTQLTDIAGQFLSLECSCGHAAMVSVDRLLDQGRGRSTFAQIVAGARCRSCGCKGQVIFPRIVYATPAHVAVIAGQRRAGPEKLIS